MCIDTHCHLDAPEFASELSEIIQRAAEKKVKAILLPSVQASDFSRARELALQDSKKIPGLVYTLGIHPLYTNQAHENDIEILERQIVSSLNDLRFIGVGEIGLDYFVEGLDPHKQEFFSMPN